MCTDYYCQECGCEIRHSMDIGFVGTELQSRSVFPGSKQKEYFCKITIICKSCKDDADRLMEEIATSPEFEIDAAFEEFYRKDEKDKNLREVFA